MLHWFPSSHSPKEKWVFPSADFSGFFNLTCFALFFFVCDAVETRSWELSCGLRTTEEADGVLGTGLGAEENLAKTGEWLLCCCPPKMRALVLSFVAEVGFFGFGVVFVRVGADVQGRSPKTF